jgi:hypothetical protein
MDHQPTGHLRQDARPGAAPFGAPLSVAGLAMLRTVAAPVTSTFHDYQMSWPVANQVFATQQGKCQIFVFTGKRCSVIPMQEKVTIFASETSSNIKLIVCGNS